MSFQTYRGVVSAQDLVQLTSDLSEQPRGSIQRVTGRPAAFGRWLAQRLQVPEPVPVIAGTNMQYSTLFPSSAPFSIPPPENYVPFAVQSTVAVLAVDELDLLIHTHPHTPVRLSAGDILVVDHIQAVVNVPRNRSQGVRVVYVY